MHIFAGSHWTPTCVAFSRVSDRRGLLYFWTYGNKFVCTLTRAANLQSNVCTWEWQMLSLTLPCSSRGSFFNRRLADGWGGIEAAQDCIPVEEQDIAALELADSGANQLMCCKFSWGSNTSGELWILWRQCFRLGRNQSKNCADEAACAAACRRPAATPRKSASFIQAKDYSHRKWEQRLQKVSCELAPWGVALVFRREAAIARKLL